MSEITWTVSGGSSNSAKVPYVGVWETFSKLDDKEKKSLFNAMRAQLIADGKMEDKGGA